MKDRVMKSRLKLCLLVGAMLLLIAGVILSVGIVKRQAAKSNNPTTEKQYKFVHQEYDAPGELNNHTDIGVMIMDCDARANFKTISNATFTSRANEYVQGTGAMKLLSLRYKDQTPYAQLEPVNIADYDEGSVHVSVYVNDPKLLAGKSLVFELTSGGVHDKDELSWHISPAVLKTGWNELYLGMEDAKITGEPNLSNINYFRTYAQGANMGLKIFMDAVYATNTEGTDIAGPIEYASTKQGYLLDMDTLKGLGTDGSISLSNKAGQYKEGIAAVSIKNPITVWLTANMQPTDITEYQKGKLSFWLYINNATYVKNGNVVVELSSSGGPDVNEIQCVLPGSNLKTGWNEVSVNLASATKTGGDIDFAKVKFFRIFGMDCSNQLELIIDAVKVEKSVARKAEDGLITDCDTIDDFIKVGGTVTSVAGEFKQGTGALKIMQTDNIWWTASLKDMVDVSKYEKGGVSLWIYVDDASKIASSLQFELGSGGNYDVDEYQWEIAKLNTGWNHIQLAFEDGTKTGKPDLAGLNFMRLTGQAKGTICLIIDDIRAIENAGEEVPDGTTVDTDVAGMIFSADSYQYVKISGSGNHEITRVPGEYVQGTGAYKSTGSGHIRLMGTLKIARDLSSYKEGYLELSLYIKDKSVFKSDGILLELSSAGKADADELCWSIMLASLKEGWNTVKLPFSSATTTGTLDYEAINFIRIYTDKAETSKDIVMIIDNIHAVANVEEKIPEGTTVDTDVEGMIFSGDSYQYMKVTDSGIHEITRAKGEYVQGTGAYKSSGAGQIRLMGTFETARDLSAYKDGTLELSLYIKDKRAIKSDGILLELSSAGKADADELCWGIPLATLQDGWNTVKLPFASAAATGKTNYEAINFMRIYTMKVETNEDIVLIIDNIHAVSKDEVSADEPDDQPEETPIEGMLIDCDDARGLNISANGNWSITNVDGEYKQGTGALKNTGTTLVWWGIKLDEAVDISDYQTGGLHLWLYVNDTSLITSSDVTVELGSGGNSETNVSKWKIPLDSLENGWQEICLDLDMPKTTLGTTNLSAINWFRIYAEASTDLTVMLDDVRAVEMSDATNQKEWLLYKNKTIEGVLLADTSLNLDLTGEERENLSLYVRLNIPEDVYNRAVAGTWRIKFSNNTNSTPEAMFVPEITSAGVYEQTFAFKDIGDSGNLRLSEIIKSCRFWNNGSTTSIAGVVIEEMKIISTTKEEEETPIQKTWVLYENKTIDGVMLADTSLNLDLTEEERENLSLYVRLNIPEDVYNRAVAGTWRIKFSNNTACNPEAMFVPDITSAGVYEQTFAFTDIRDSGNLRLSEIIKSCRLWNNGSTTSIAGVVIEEMKIISTDSGE